MTSNEKCISNEFKKAKVILSKNSSSPDLISISKLEQGFYMITFCEIGMHIRLTVHKGTYWKDDSFILKKDSLREFTSNKKIAYVKVKKEKKNIEENKDEFTLKLCNFGENTRVHIMTTNFISHNDLTSYFTIKSIFDSSIKNERFKLSQWKNAYLSNRKLGDEYRYVFERKYLKTFPGNSLVHPQILLKRMKIRETTFEQEVANLGDPYQNIQVQMMNRGYSREFAEKSVEREAPRFQVGIGNVPHYNRHSMHDGLRKGGILKKRRRRDYSGSHDNHTQLPDIDQYKSYLNFLKHSGILKSNLVPDKNGNVSFTVPGGKYTNLIVIASDNENIVQTNINLPSHPAKFLKRNLNLKESLDPKKNFNEVRKVLKFSKDGKHKIKDMTSADYNIIDTLEKVKNIQLEIAKMDGCDICPDLLFLTSWHRLTFEEQIKKYTLYISHEVHLFLYFKDKPFFDKVVKPFLMNKFERSFIDYWLLEDYEEIEKYSKVEFFDMLNSVEK